MLTHPTHDRLIALGLTGMAKALEDQRRQPDVATLLFEERLAMMIDREAIEREQAPRTPPRRTPASASPLSSRTSTTKPRAASTGRCSKNSLPASGSHGTRICSSSAQPASAKVGLLARSATRPAATTAPPTIIAYPGCSMRWRSLAVTAAMRGSSRTWHAPIC